MARTATKATVKKSVKSTTKTVSRAKATKPVSRAKASAAVIEEFNMHESIIESAGKIYNFLNENGEVSINKMKKELDLKNNFAELGLGWLAREDKLNYNVSGKTVNISLR